MTAGARVREVIGKFAEKQFESSQHRKLEGLCEELTEFLAKMLSETVARLAVIIKLKTDTVESP